MYNAPTDLSQELQARIIFDREHHITNPYRCEDEHIIRRFDAPHDRATLWRPAFVRDTQKIINTPAYNRYTGKTQVFSFTRNDDISRRGLHVQLVARVARDIGAALGLNLDLIEAIALGHDIGHTPFGHTGERALDAVYHKQTGRYFRHNIQSVQVLDRMYCRNNALQVLDGVLCHNGEYEQRVFRTSNLASFEEFDALIEKCRVQGDAAIDTLVPMTLEGCVVRISDIIAYVGKDRQDAVAAGLLPHDAPFKTGAVGGYNSWVLQTLTVDIVEHSYGKDHIEMSEQAFDELARAKRENYELIYRNPQVEGICDESVFPLFEELYDRMYDDLVTGNESSPIFKQHIEPLSRQTGYYDRVYTWQEDLHQTTADFISSLTDDCFIALYEHEFPKKLSKIPWRDYYEATAEG
ncbi:MAG: HD domain-containing protein [Coriobacteriales bacterium]|nr:HD domain-containing protein [Coriobacteriales bacterium]